MAKPWERDWSGQASASGAQEAASVGGKPWERDWSGATRPRGQASFIEAQPWQDTRTPLERDTTPTAEERAAREPSRGDVADTLGDWGVPFFASENQRQAYVDRQTRNAPGRLATAVQAPTLGFGDEILGGLGGVVSMLGGGNFSEGYEPVRDTIRDASHQYVDENPASAIGVSLVGGAPTAMAAAPRALLEATAPLARFTGMTAYGAGLGSVAGFGEGEENLEGRMDSAGAGAMVGAGLGVAGEALGRVLRRWIGRGQPFRVLDDQGGVTSEGAAMVREAGLDPASVPPNLLQRLDEVAVRAGGRPADPMAARRMAEAESLPVPVPLERGQAMDNATLMARSNRLAQGREGEVGRGIMRDFRQEQQNALMANVPALRERVAAGGPLIERNQGGEVVSRSLNELRDVERSNVDDLYSQARGLDATGADRRNAGAVMPINETQGRVAAPVEGYVPEATADVQFARAANPKQEPGIINAIQRMGGIRTMDAQGRLTSEGGDLRAIFNGRYPPGLINNKAGKPLDYVREQLAADGWFPGRDPQEVSLSEVLDLIGGRARNPLSARSSTREAGTRDQLRGEMEGLGIRRATPVDEAAGRLSLSRDAANRGDPQPVFGEPELSPPSSVHFTEPAGLDIARRAMDAIKVDHAPANVPKVMAELRGLGKKIEAGTVSPRDMFEARARLRGARSGGGEDAVAAPKAIAAMDDAINDALDRAQLVGDEEAISAFREANRHYREYADTFKRRDMIGALVKRDPGRGWDLKVDPRDATNFMFGQSNLGFVNKRDFVRDAMRIRDTLGTESDAWSAMKQEAFNRFADAGRGRQTPNGPLIDGDRLANAWEKMARENPELVRLFFDADVRRDIGNWVNVARRVTSRDAAAYGAARVDTALGRLMEYGLRRIRYVGPWLAAGARWASGAASRARGSAAAREATSGALPRYRPLTPSLGAQAIGGTVGALEQLRGP